MEQSYILVRKKGNGNKSDLDKLLNEIGCYHSVDAMTLTMNFLVLISAISLMKK